MSISGISTGMTMPPPPQNDSQRMRPEGGQNGEGGPKGPPPGKGSAIPPGVDSVLSESQLSDVKSTLESLTDEQKQTLHSELKSLHETARSNDFSIEEVADSYLAILDGLTGTTETSVETSSSEFQIDVYV